MNRRVRSDCRSVAAYVVVVQHKSFIRLIRLSERRANINPSPARIHRHGNGPSELPIDRVPGRLNLFRDFQYFTAPVEIEPGPVRDHYPILAYPYSVDGWRADFL